MTNPENDYVTLIENAIQHAVCEHAIADIIDIIECCYILLVVRTILYDEPKPLK